jgi:hypothetical protein
MSWIVVLCALQAPADAVEPQDPDRPTYSLADLKALREANVFAPHRSKSAARTSSPRREDRRETRVEAPPARAKGLLVTGFIVDPATRTPRAVLEDRNDEKFRTLKEPLFAKPGDEAQGWKVEEVAVDQVVVSKAEVRKTLRLGESFPEPEAAATPASTSSAGAPAPAAEAAPPLEEGEKNDILERLKQKNKKKRSESADEP